VYHSSTSAISFKLEKLFADRRTYGQVDIENSLVKSTLPSQSKIIICIL